MLSRPFPFEGHLIRGLRRALPSRTRQADYGPFATQPGLLLLGLERALRPTMNPRDFASVANDALLALSQNQAFSSPPWYRHEGCERD
jgi:hypothetical protein